MKLLSLFLKDFKGIDELSIFLNGNNVTIYGDNGTGKTAIADAFHWLLFGKDSLGQSEFEIKPLDENNRWVPGKVPTVSAELEHHEGKIHLQKEYVEKWTTPRGSSEKVFSGHTVKYYIDEAPVTKGEFDKRVNEIVDSKLFRLLSDPLYFNVHLHWEERRKLLMEICGNLTMENIIEANDKFAILPDMLGNRTVDKHMEMLKDKRKKLSESKNTIPARIDELKKGLPDVSKYNQAEVAEVEAQLAQERADLQQKQQELSFVQAGGPKNHIRELEIEIAQYIANFKEETQTNIDTKKEAINTLKEEIFAVKQNIQETEGQIRKSKQEIDRMDVQIKELRQKYIRINTKPELETIETCPVCLQTVPAEQLKTIHEKIIAEHNIKISEELTAINKQGKQLAAQKSQLETNIHELEDKLYAEQQTLADLQTKLDASNKELAELKEWASIGYKEDPGYHKLQQELEQLKNAADPTNTTQTEEIQQSILSIQQSITEKQELLHQIKDYEKDQSRIKELQTELKTTATELEQVEKDIKFIEEFEQTKVKILESEINSNFTMAKFKLFEKQTNGVIADTCETLFNGVPYSSMNNGARINIGLDIINKFGEYYNFRPPVFVDNAEAVTNLLPTNSQLIKLVVKKGERLNVVVEQELPAIPVYAGEPDF